MVCELLGPGSGHLRMDLVQLLVDWLAPQLLMDWWCFGVLLATGLSGYLLSEHVGHVYC